MKTKRLLKICALVLCIGPAQMATAQNRVVTPSPESISSIERIQNPVDMNSGTLSVNVPLYNIQSKGINVPVSLTYRATGIKVEAPESSVGLGWNLSAGGKITRIVKQYPDDTHAGTWGDGSQTAFSRFFDNVDMLKYKNYNQMNSEPDVFFFEIPGNSGMFVLDYQGNAHTIPHQNITIEWIEPTAAGANYFVITDRNGNKYKFGSIELSKERTSVTYKNQNLNKFFKPDNWRETIEYISTWHLDEIENYTGNKVEFLYEDFPTREYPSKTTVYEVWYDLSNQRIDEIDSEEEEVVDASIDTKLIKNITWDSGSLSFNNSYVERYPRLTSIRLYDSRGGFFLRHLGLTYITIAERLHLDKLTESTGTISHNICSFVYNTNQTLPVLPHPAIGVNRDTFDYDAWGYYNGAGNTTNRSVIPEMPGAGGATRTPSLDHAKAQVLTAVTYPAGGRTEYEYELHQDTRDYIGGLRIKSVKQIASADDYTQTNYEYKDSLNNSSGSRYRDPSFGFFNYREGSRGYYTVFSRPANDIYDFTGKHVSYSRVRAIYRDGSYTDYEFTGNQEEYADEMSILRWENNLTFPNVPGDIAPRHFQNSPKFWLRGLPISTTHRTSTGGMISRTKNSYTVSNSASPIKGYIPSNYRGNSLAGNSSGDLIVDYQWQPQTLRISTATTSEGINTFYSRTTYGYNDDHQTLSWSETADHDLNNSNIDRITVKYPHDYILTSHALVTAKEIALLQQQNMANVPMEATVWRNGKVLSSKYTGFEMMTLDNGKQVALPKYEYTLIVDNPISDFQESVFSLNMNPARMVWDPRYELTNTITYDRKGNAISSMSKTGHSKSTVLGYNDAYVIAEVDNAAYTVGTERTNQVFYTSFEHNGENGSRQPNPKSGDMIYNNGSAGNSYAINLSNFKPGEYVVTYWGKDPGPAGNNPWIKFVKFITVTSSTSSYSISGNTYFDEVSIIPVDARINTYTYKPHIGMTSSTDYAGFTTYYEYDEFGRQTTVRDNNRAVIRHTEYNIAH